MSDGIRLRDTLSGDVRPLEPLEPGHVRIYSCGPTVYGPTHIGNFRSFLFADLLVRHLRHRGLRVTWVMNITDIDDKIIRGAAAEGVSTVELAERWTARFLLDADALGMTRPDVVPQATGHIPQITSLVATLIERGHAYRTEDGSVFFRIASWPAYGVLAKLDPEAMRVGERVEADEYAKEEVRDFAVWKGPKPGEPSWSTEIGEGRPGWHIECSAMSMAHLGESFDIHTGGIDLIFPHHENEIAQSTAGKTDPAYARVFVHNEHILVDGKKMSKSLGNFYTLKDIVDKGYDPLAFRLLALQSHYRSQAHFSFDNLEAAQNRLKALRNIAELRHQVADRADDAQQTFIDQSTRQIQDEIANDLNTPAVLETIALAADEFERNGVTSAATEHFNKWLQTIDNLLGLQLLDSTPDISPEQKHLIADRESARQAKDWDKADRLRKQLEDRGIGLRDTPNGAVWFRS